MAMNSLKHLATFAICTLFLTACGSKPTSYLPAKSEPIVNIEAEIAEQVQVKAEKDHFTLENLANTALQVQYKLFWYDKQGVSQALGEQRWQSQWLQPKASAHIATTPPTADSTNYRLYLKR